MAEITNYLLPTNRSALPGGSLCTPDMTMCGPHMRPLSQQPVTICYGQVSRLLSAADVGPWGHWHEGSERGANFNPGPVSFYS